MSNAILHESNCPGVPTIFSYMRPGALPATKTPSAEACNTDEMFGSLYGVSPAMRAVFNLIARVAPSEAPVLVVGESGSGKELVAETLHKMSTRANAPFVAVNCGALPATLVESELFGYEKGAFTGANKTHAGFFERAEGGTLFLDEITEMPVELQVRLLRVLEAGSFLRVGGDREIACNIRIVAASNREPMLAVRNGHLREDLLYRLAVVPILLPPLRERQDDIGLLAAYFLRKCNLRYGTNKRFAPDVNEKLSGHRWPGNVRELRNCVERAYVISDQTVEIDTLTPLGIYAASLSRDTLEFEIGTSLGDAEKRLILAALDRFQGNKCKTARALGISLKTIYNKLSSYSCDDIADLDAGMDEQPL